MVSIWEDFEHLLGTKLAGRFSFFFLTYLKGWEVWFYHLVNTVDSIPYYVPPQPNSIAIWTLKCH